MTFDLTNDLVVIYGWSVGLSSFIIWISAVVGFVANLVMNFRLYKKQYEGSLLSDLAWDAFVAAEKAAKITPMSSDDKLLEFLKYSMRAFKISFNRKPRADEINILELKAKAYADEDKLTKLNSEALLKSEIEDIKNKIIAIKTPTVPEVPIKKSAPVKKPASAKSVSTKSAKPAKSRK